MAAISADTNTVPVAHPIYMDNPRDGSLDQDNVLPLRHDSSINSRVETRWDTPRGIKTPRTRTAILFTLGTFLAACPLPRQYITGHYSRAAILSIITALIMFPAHGALRGHSTRSQRALVAYSGFFIAMYALVGSADAVHIGLLPRSLMWIRTYEGYRMGYLIRIALQTWGFIIQRSAGLHSRARIWLAYLLCLLWVYCDVPLTIVEMACGRERW